MMRFLGEVLAVLAVLGSIGPNRAAAEEKPPVHTNHRRFRIPYRYDAAEMQRLGARSIRLFLSENQGEDWKPVESVPPQTGHFEFEVPRDGEYWFAVSTVDHQGTLHPSASHLRPGLKVLVDTTPPQLALDLRQIAPGKVRLAWRASDAHLDPSTLRLESIQAGQSDWQSVDVVPQANGETSWPVDPGSRIAVRGSIRDRASNVGRQQKQITVRGNRRPDPDPAGPNLRGPIASSETKDSGASYRHGSPELPDPFQSKPTSTPPTSSPETNRPEPSRPKFTQAVPEPPQNATERSPIIAPKMPGRTVSEDPEQRPETLQGRYSTSDSQEGSRPFSRDRFRVVGSKSFQIDYKLQDVGPSGVSKVELFITQDGGEKWWKYGEDDDRQSPLQVEVPEDGRYGFLIRVHSGVGLAADPPRPGDEPAIVVVVDKTPPQAELESVQPVGGTESQEILVRWEINEENPATRSVALFYSSNPSGPWEPITGWQKNRGEFRWDVGPGVPSQIYLRLAARDAAGNVRHVKSEEPIMVDFSKPSARIVNIESVSTSDR